MVETLHQNLVLFFSKSGYETTFESSTGVEMKSNGFIFSDMLDGEYIEATLSMCDNNLLISYDVFERIYAQDIFVNIPDTLETAADWKRKLVSEVERMKLGAFLDFGESSPHRGQSSID